MWRSCCGIRGWTGCRVALMRSVSHMRALLAVSALAAVAGVEAVGGPMPQPSQPRKIPPTRDSILTTGKPPMNGAREVARRLRQMQRKAAKAKP